MKAADHLAQGGHLVFSNCADGQDGLVLADLARALTAQTRDRPAAMLHIARDGARSASLEAALQFYAPEIDVVTFPAWDCQPYDRVSPNAAVIARRMTALSRLATTRGGDRPRIVLATVNAALQRVPARDLIAAQSLSAAPGNAVNMDRLAAWLEHNGYLRSSTVRETGEYAVRGGILDLYPPGLPMPVRLDFFGDTLESIRSFDVETQRSSAQLRMLDLVPMSEVQLTTETIKRFRQAYLAEFGAQTRGDPLYEAISEGRRYVGLEHWLPLFHTRLDTLFDYLPGVPVALDALAEDAAGERLAQIKDYYDARRDALGKPGESVPYKPLGPDRLYFGPEEWRRRLDESSLVRITPFSAPGAPGREVVDCGGKQGHTFAAERAAEDANVFDAVIRHIRDLQGENKRVIVAGWTDGSRERLGAVLSDHGLTQAKPVPDFARALALPKSEIALGILPLETGFTTRDLAIISEQDILGDRLVRRTTKRKRAQDFLTEIGTLSPGDVVVHVEHGIGRFVGLQTVTAVGAPHDCLEIHYAGGDKLFLPVENLELLSRYGSEDAEAQLDKLGGRGWQERKARMKKRIREMAGELIKIAAARALREAPKLVPAQGIYDEFAARFPYSETEDQQFAIDSVLDDLASGRPMDRLVCGDVGFGKTEVALRAAFACALAGRQVAVVVPTTLLARQHTKTFADRFKGLPVKVAQLSRFVSAEDARKTRAGLASGDIDIVVGTHALLAKTISFRDLGLLIIDEEQHFGVGHKERLKQLRAEVHVLTLSATPIPRTLQLALTGVRELSIIATPPVDRLAVRTFVTPFDPVVLREALMRERYRGGQSFFVVPRIEDIADAKAFLNEYAPEAKVAIGHGQMAAGQLEDVMTAFYEGKYDILLSTTIVESGLDIPTANTLVVWRADMFGLAQLYQLRGRVGRSKTRAYALFTLPANRTITPGAERRLKVLQSLDTLGAGFQLASHDLDIRGAGNLLGDEQSGHIKEVGYELYQQMLEEAVAALKDGGVETEVEEQWSPQITIGTPVMIPEDYVPDLTLRLSLYRRLSSLDTDAEIDAFGAELTDRFGERPAEVDQLLRLMSIKALCRRANVEKVDAGPKGVVVSFRENSFANPNGLVRYIADQGSFARVRPDMRILFQRDFEQPNDRLKGTAVILKNLARIAETKQAA
ncbi:transcription-repair-coupling factor [Labrys miyagiensis]|uniref:Transcription-repair-coupling factor n=1 Tax=Labrys miyagiensis TaxID=346912 RepID=A0ABQ6CJ66_9HYPH|nr:transcription-repair coupling factor [Labrys miyagiensis]GLS20311.1 transcription-repair-coupling factor [Labrys miyagiensis]